MDQLYELLADGDVDDSIFDPRYSPCGLLPEGDGGAYLTSHHRLATMCALQPSNALSVLCSIPLSSLAFVAREVSVRSLSDPDAVCALEVVASAMRRRRVPSELHKRVMQH